MTPTQKQCRKCNVVRSVTEFNKFSRSADGLHSYCKPCRREESREWRKNHPGYQTAKSKEWRSNNRERHRELSRKWLDENPEAGRAHRRVYKAIKAGKLVRPDICSVCKKPGKIEAHHEDYSKPLEVEWLCTTCHMMETKNATYSR